jgi:hypothetical protein
MHRNQVAESRSLNPLQDQISPDIRIAKDGKVIRSLGAWIGYNTKEEKPWEPILNKIRTELKKKGKPPTP